MNLYHREYGDGPSLLILHGLFGSSDNWLTITKKLSEDFRVILADLRNHGRSFHDPEFNYQVMTEDILRLLDSLGIEKVNILGHSMGGKAAMHFAIHHRTYMEKLIVADIGPKYYPPHHQQIIKGLKSINLSQLNSRNEADEILSQHVDTPAARQFLLKNLGRGENGGYVWKMNLDVIIDHIENVGEAIITDEPYDLPVQFIRGELSDYILDTDIPDIKNFFPKSKCYTLPGSGHWVHADNPADFYFTVISFLQS